MRPDTLAALVTYLRLDHDLEALVGDRIHGQDLPPRRPRDEAPADWMPRKAVVLKMAGGPTLEGTVELDTERIDAFCYGETPFEAGRVRNALFDRLRALERVTSRGAFLHSGKRTGGPRYLVDPDTDWPVIVETWELLSSTVSVA